MADVFSENQRSKVMAAVPGKGNRSTELRMVDLLRKQGIKGWRRHAPVPGRPDFVFPKLKLAVFVDGCFWHGCPKCYRAPATHKVYWKNKVDRNRKRDQRVTRQLRSLGWSVARVKECTLSKNPEAVSSRIRRMLARDGDSP